ncbi:MAG TPA: anthranilate phosphoribosyltransferase [Sedimentisphaerales bacterium]|nr:anthranilate phosphoribosyltransferase [Sedimentisphaerales bacterium]
MTAITEYLEIVLEGRDLSFEQSKAVLDTIFEGAVDEIQIAAFLTAMRFKKPCATELAGLAGSLRSHAVAVNISIENLVDTCGTGAGRVKTFNISTAAALVAAGAGVYIAKHGNRGITSKCGSADVLAELGVNIDPGPAVVAECIQQCHIGFMFAPKFHPAMRYVQGVRQKLGFRTVFNILGPLANPAKVRRQVMGVADEGLMPLIAEALKLLGAEYAMIVHSNGMDEISTAWTTKITELRDGRIFNKELNAEDFGIAAADMEQLKASDVQGSAKAIKDILAGKDTGPRKDIVLLNAAAAIIAGGLADDFATAIGMADASVSKGKALKCLEKLIIISNAAG